jgi:mannosyl-3-phosphoglycerate phosphatase
MQRLVVFTDLDGTLLDHETYKWKAAEPALRRLRGRGVPLVLCTSKTRAEVLPLRRELELPDPFVAENGGAIYIPRNYFPFALPTARVDAGFQVLALGQRYQTLVRALDEAAKTSGVQVRGFSRMKDQEVAKVCGLPRVQARLARRREFDEPFLLEKGTARQQERFFRWLQQRGLRWREGGRFFHLMGDNDKGVAVSKLIDLYRQQYDDVHTVGLGDSPNDIDFLAVVDTPMLVARPDGDHSRETRSSVPRAALVKGIGPEGWNQAVLDILKQTEAG